jgi:hypothetical protein
VKRSVGSSCGIREELGTTVWPFFPKYSKKDLLISDDVIILFYTFQNLLYNIIGKTFSPKVI